MKTIMPTLLLLLALIGGIALWVMPMGGGEYKDSSDNQYTAWASNLTRGTLAGRMQYIELRIVKKETGELIWRIERNINQDDKISKFEDRSKKFIQWSADSSSVTFVVSEKQQLVIPVQ